MKNITLLVLELGLISAVLVSSSNAAAVTSSTAEAVISDETTSCTRPNILFCVADDASFRSFGAYDSTWVRTPTFDSVARQGVLFTHAYTPTAKCSPSRSAIITGRNPWQLKAAGNHYPFFPKEFGTFMETLAAHGYDVGFTGKGWAPGNPGKVKGKKRELTGRAYNSIKLTPPTGQISNVNYAANFEAFLDQRSQNKPFCFWYGGHEPHRPYAYGSGAAKDHATTASISQVPAYWPDSEQVRNDMLDYGFEVEYFDSQLAKILEILKDHGQMNNTLIVVTSDNGMPFPRVKGNTYEFANHLPLAVMWKGGLKNPGRKVDDYISFIDFAPTFLQAADVKANGDMQPITGRSFLDILKSGKSGKVDPVRDHVLLGRERNDVGRPNDEGYPMRGIVAGGFLYVRNYHQERWPGGNPETGYMDVDKSPTKSAVLDSRHGGSDQKFWKLSFGMRPAEELYKIDSDFDAMDNLATSTVYAKEKARLAGRMEQELKEERDPRMFGHGDDFDKYPYSNPKMRNFYNRYMEGEKFPKLDTTDFETVKPN